MGRVAMSKQRARAKARTRRIALKHDRVARYQRAEAAQVITALGERDGMLGQVRAPQARAGDALLRFIAEGTTVDGVTRLRDLSAGEARRLRRSAQAAQDLRSHAEAAGPNPGGSAGGSAGVSVRAQDAQAARRPAAARCTFCRGWLCLLAANSILRARDALEAIQPAAPLAGAVTALPERTCAGMVTAAAGLLAGISHGHEPAALPLALVHSARAGHDLQERFL
jgi:hypothetical protein